MTRRSIALLLPFLFLVSVHALEKTKDTRKPLAIEDLYLLEFIKNMTLAPGGKEAVYVRNWIDAGTKLERHSLWRVVEKRDNAKPLEKDEPDARQPVYSPDGKWIAFLSTRARPQGWKQIPPTPPESDPACDIWVMAAQGGPALPLSGPEKPYGRVFSDNFYGRVAFSPDGKKLVFVADDGSDPRTTQELANDVIIVRADQGEGYTGFGPAQIWVAHLDTLLEKSGDKGKAPQIAASKIDRLTKDDVWYGDPQWSPDGKVLVVHANKTSDRESVRFSINKDFDLFAINLETRTQNQLTSGPGPDVCPRFSPDGKKLAFLSIPRKGSHRDTFNLGIVNLADQKVETLFDHHQLKEGDPPHPAPAFPLPDDCWDGAKELFYRTEIGLTTKNAMVDVQTGKGSLPGLSANLPKDPSTREGRQFFQSQFTPPVNTFLSGRLQGLAQAVTWMNEKRSLEGIITTPPPEIAKPPYKLIVYPHGGPHSRAAFGFDFTVQVFAAQGYAVFQPNFRGSSGYGQKFIDADRNDFGGGDMRDILSGINTLVKQGKVDKDNQFVYGISYGGYMTTWLVGQTKQFKAAVAQNAVTDLTMMWALSDLQSWTEWEFHGYPWQVPEAMKKHSPLTYLNKVTTPTLILHARDDRRCPLPMGLAYHQGLKARGVPTQMVIYPNEGHGIRQPRHREDVLRRVLDWFAKYEKKSN